MTFRANGMRAWLIQRLSAAYLALIIIFAVLWWFSQDLVSYAEWKTLIAHPLSTVLLGLFFSALLVHAWVGMRDVLVDYVPNLRVRLFLLIFIAGSLLAMGIWISLILISVVQI